MAETLAVAVKAETIATEPDLPEGTTVLTHSHRHKHKFDQKQGIIVKVACFFCIIDNLCKHYLFVKVV